MLIYYFNAYIAVIGDVVASRTLKDRCAVQEKLKIILAGINQTYEEDLASKFMITLGDEFQGLLKYGGHLADILSEIEAGLSPVELRFGVGIGSIDTSIDPEFPLGADGPAYHNARQMVESLKKNEKKYGSYDSNILLMSGSKGHDLDDLLNTIFSLCCVVKSKWTKRQKEIISCYLTSGQNQYKTAERLGIEQSNVNRALKSANFYSYQKAKGTVNEALRGVDNRNHV